MKKPELKDFKLKESDFKLLSEQEKRYEIAKAEHQKKVTILLCIGYLVVAIILGFIFQAIFKQGFWVGFAVSTLPCILLFNFIHEKFSDFSGNEYLYIDEELRENIQTYKALLKKYNELKEIEDNSEVEKNDTLIDNNSVSNTTNKNYEDLKQLNNKNILISTETTLTAFINYLVNKGYKKYSNVGNPSTAIEYAQSVKKVANWENVSVNEIIKNIDYYVKRYNIGGAREKSGQIGHATIINALKRFREFLKTNKLYVPTDEDYIKSNKNLILSSKIEKIKASSIRAHVPKELLDKYSENNQINQDIDCVTHNSIITIKYLDEENDNIVKVTGNKNRSNNTIQNIENVPLLKKLLNKNKGDIIEYKTENSSVQRIKIIDIEN